MRIDMLMEDAATIEKGMSMIAQLEKEGAGNSNQMVRWIMNKDQHAAAIQETVASYWLAQRIKTPKEDNAEARAKYLGQLVHMHGITVAAMKCKQTTDTANVAKLRALALEFSGTYFSAEDAKHIEGHHAGEKH
ncbi:MAG: nickel superoxide dismutase [Planctomycetota bacterium]|jgi:nickel superoxide dismutase